MNSASWRHELVVAIMCAGTRLAALQWLPAARRNYFWDYSDGLLHHWALGPDARVSTYLEPVYPGFIAAVRSVAGDRDAAIMLAQIIVAAIGAVALFRLGTYYGRSSRAGAIAAGIYAAYPYYVRQSVAYQSLTVETTLLILATLSFVSIRRSRDALLCGAWAALAVLTRASLAPLVALFAVSLALERRWVHSVSLVGAATLLILPWCIRNYGVDGTMIPTRVGENLFVSTCPYSRAILPGYDVDLLVPAARAFASRALPIEEQDSEAATDRVLLEGAFGYAGAHPLETIELKLTNLVYVFVPRLVPFYAKADATQAVFQNGAVRVEGAVRRPATFDLLHSAGYGSVLALGLVGLVRRRGELNSHKPLIAVVVTVTAANVLFFTTTRLAAPMTFVFMLYAGCGLTAPEPAGRSIPGKA